MPSNLANNLGIDPCPEDMANLMREIKINGKFMNIHNKMEDP